MAKNDLPDPPVFFPHPTVDDSATIADLLSRIETVAHWEVDSKFKCFCLDCGRVSYGINSCPILCLYCDGANSMCLCGCMDYLEPLAAATRTIIDGLLYRMREPFLRWLSWDFIEDDYPALGFH